MGNKKGILGNIFSGSCAKLSRGDQVVMHGMRIMSYDGETLIRMYAEA